MKYLSLSLFFWLSFAHAGTCPTAVNFVNFCGPYQATQDLLASVDYQAMGEVGPAVAKDVMSVTTVLSLAKSVWSFKPTVAQLRSNYFIPVLRVIDELQALNAADHANRAAYLKKTEDVYTDLVVTSLDVTLKTYKVAPEAARKVGFAWILASVSDPTPVPKSYSDVLSKFGNVSSDIVFNDSKTSFSQRIDRLLAMEGDLRKAVAESCRETPGPECK